MSARPVAGPGLLPRRAGADRAGGGAAPEGGPTAGVVVDPGRPGAVRAGAGHHQGHQHPAQRHRGGRRGGGSTMRQRCGPSSRRPASGGAPSARCSRRPPSPASSEPWSSPPAWRPAW